MQNSTNIMVVIFAPPSADFDASVSIMNIGCQEAASWRGRAAKWDDLRIFLEVARHGSVHAAARQLRLDHSTVCRRIGRLEALLAVKLLDRNRKGVFVRPEAQGLASAHREHGPARKFARRDDRPQARPRSSV